MYGVELYGRVRLAVLRDGLSQREAARRFGIDRGTVAKMLKHSVPPGYTRVMPVRRPKLAEHTGFIDQILDEDETAPRKQRHTARRIFERLRDERGYDGGYSTVRDYLRPRRLARKEVFVPLTHPPGHGQSSALQFLETTRCACWTRVGRSGMTDTGARGAGPVERAQHAGDDGPAPAGGDPRGRQRMSAKRKQSAVLRLLRGEDLELVSRELRVTAAELSAWRDAFLAAGEASLKTRPADGRDVEIARLKAKVGDLTMANELLDAKIERMETGRPLARRRSRP